MVSRTDGRLEHIPITLDQDMPLKSPWWAALA
jgi:hypothetical protein